MKINKENLVFKWEWTKETIESFKKSGNWFEHTNNYHCKDKQVISYKHNDEIWLKDTYWGDSDPFKLRPNQFKNINLTFIADLDDYKELIDVNEFNRYKDEYEISELLCLYIHAGYRNRYFVKKDAKPSLEVKKSKIKEKISEYEKSIEYDKKQIEYLNRDLEKLINWEFK